MATLNYATVLLQQNLFVRDRSRWPLKQKLFGESCEKAELIKHNCKYMLPKPAIIL